MSCIICGKTELVSSPLNVCLNCIRMKFSDAVPFIKKAHAESRKKFNLPAEPPRDPQGVRCGLCVNSCVIGIGRMGYCGLRKNENGRLIEKGIVECYYDALPTNCVADWCCPGGTGAGYPKFSYSKNAPEYGYKNLAVFYGACTFNCLFCQNWHYRERARNLSPSMSAQELASWADEKTSCICYFGGDPAAQMPHALRTSELAIERAKGKILRICWESNGSMSLPLLKKAAELSLESGGIIKFDLKAWDENLNIALAGVTNKQTLKNFERLAEYGVSRRMPPFLTASTLLVPGYIDAAEVENIAKFIAGLDDEIPYSLLAFCPQFYMKDLPTTSRRQAEECCAAAKKYLKNVRIGNVHLLS
ncbi:MAG: radical SAM protein [Euryarchaeota archaeon]|nr:radical SAM protein [Euryarchaeota archaeon]